MNEILRVGRNEGKDECRTAFVFSCPGQEELKSGRLVNGQTGRNLDGVLEILNKKYPEIFHSADRYDYRITNSSDIVHYKAHDGRSEPKIQEITDPQNLERLRRDIEGYSYVITFGRSAQSAVSAAIGDNENSIKLIYSRHLSFLSLNSTIHTDINGAPIIRGEPDSPKKRLEVAAKIIEDQL